MPFRSKKHAKSFLLAHAGGLTTGKAPFAPPSFECYLPLVTGSLFWGQFRIAAIGLSLNSSFPHPHPARVGGVLGKRAETLLVLPGADEASASSFRLPGMS